MKIYLHIYVLHTYLDKLNQKIKKKSKSFLFYRKMFLFKSTLKNYQVFDVSVFAKLFKLRTEANTSTLGLLTD